MTASMNSVSSALARIVASAGIAKTVGRVGERLCS